MTTDHEVLAKAFERAAFEQDLWPTALEQARQALDANLVAIIKMSSNGAQLLGPPELAEQHMEAYRSGEWHLRDPRAAACFTGELSPMRMLTDVDVLTKETIETNEFYRDFAVQQDVPFSLFWRFNNGTETYAFVTLFSKDHGPPSRNELTVLRGLQARATAAAIISNTVQLSRDEGLMTGLEAAGVAAIALNDRGQVVATTPTGQILLDECFVLRDGQLSAENPQAARVLAQLARGDITNADPTSLMFVLPRNGGQRGVLGMAALNAGIGLDIFRGVHAILVLKDLNAAKTPHDALLSTVFKLTPAEIEVANQVAAGLSPEAISRGRDVAITTTRAILRTLFAKTGVTRQSELAALIARLS